MKYVYEIENGRTGETEFSLFSSMDKALAEAKSLLALQCKASRVKTDRFATSGFAFGYDDHDQRVGWYAINRRHVE